MPARGARFPTGLLVALALVILLAGFLLGRRSAPVAPPSPSAAPIAQAPEPPATTYAQPTTEPTIEPPAFAEPSPSPVPEPPLLSLPPTAVPGAPPAEGVRASAAVARYFEDADAIEARTKYWSDPTSLAKTILEQAASGNTAGFDELLSKQAEARAQLERMAVPSECAEHHRRALSVMTEGLALLARVRDALASGDVAGLDGLQEKARALEREAKEVDELGRRLRGR